MSSPSISTAVPSTCWNCSVATGGAHFCPACGKIQPLPQTIDYFAFFGLPRKLFIDLPSFERQFHSLSWKLHPDNFVRASESERQLSLDRASQLNDAYRILADPVSRVEYLLSLAGMRKEGQKKQQAPPELLEEVFELNETLDELREARQSGGSDPGLGDLRVRLQEAQSKFAASLRDVDQELMRIAGEWDRVIDAGSDEAAQKRLMEQMNETLNRRSYVRNLVKSVVAELAS
jgi:molecular chaperone HscB